MQMSTMCIWCKHFEEDTTVWPFVRACPAFPNGFPDIMYPTLSGGPGFDHRYPHPDDQGIRFEMEEDYLKLLTVFDFQNYRDTEHDRERLFAYRDWMLSMLEWRGIHEVPQDADQQDDE